MKLILLLLILGANVVWSKEIKDFNKVLIETVKTDLNNQNVDQFQKKSLGRAPASIESEVNPDRIKEDQKFDKQNIRQTGFNKW